MGSLSRALGSAVFVLLLVVAAQADTIYMRNGSVIRGRVVNYTGGQFTVMLDAGGQSRATLSGSEIERIEFDATGDQTGGAAPYTPPRAGADSHDPSHSTETYDPAPTADDHASAPPVDDPVDAAPVSDAGAVTVSVPANADWAPTQVRVRRGDRVRVTASGSATLDRAGRRTVTPAGSDIPDRNKLLTSKPTGGLIAVIGDDNDDFIFIGSQAEFTAQRNGMLFLSVNEGDLTDNTGTFMARVAINPPRGSAAPVASAPRAAESRPAAQPQPQPRPSAPAAAPRDEAPRITGSAGSAVREATVTVPARNDWTSTQIRVTQGTRVRISADGTIQLDRGGQRVATPAGIDVPDKGKLIPGRPTGALIAVIGDDNDDFIFVGEGTEFVARRDGLLFLSVNEGELTDNSGSFAVRLVVEQPRATATR